MIKSFFWSRGKVVILVFKNIRITVPVMLVSWGGGLLLFGLLYAQVHLSVMINEWYGEFYNILQTALQYVKEGTSDEGVSKFWANLLQFFSIALPYVGIAMITNYVTRRYSVWWREAMTFKYIPRWRNVKEEIEGASQRIQEDTYRFARIVETLGLQIVRAIMTLIAFIPILWRYSSNVNVPTFELWGHTWLEGTMTKITTALKPSDLEILSRFVSNIDEVLINYIPGSLVWAAMTASLGGLIISWFVGIKLPGLEYNNQKVEAAFRKELVLAEDNKVDYGSPETLWELFLGIKVNYKRLFLHYGYFDLWVILYDQCMIIVPYAVVGPGLFHGLLTLGTMVQISNAFQKVHNGFALFVHNWTTITELRSIWRRLHEFEANLNKFDPTQKEKTKILTLVYKAIKKIFNKEK